MSKNREESTNYYLYIDGQAVPVSEQVYRVYQHYERKEEYFSYDLKTEKFQKDTAIFLPSREDSYERLLEKDKQFAASGQPVEEQAVSSVWLEELLQHLSSDETVCLLSKLQSKEHIEIEVKMDEMDLTSAESKATYKEIREYVFEHTGLKVSHLYIAQVKQKYGIIERENYNKPKSENAKQPQCPPEKEKAITEALRHFGMIL